MSSQHSCRYRARRGSRQSLCRAKRPLAGRRLLGLPHPSSDRRSTQRRGRRRRRGKASGNPSSTQARRGRSDAERRGTAASVVGMFTTPLGTRAGGARRHRRDPPERSSMEGATGSTSHPTAGHQATGLGPHLAGTRTRREPCRSIWRGRDRVPGTGRERATAHAEGSGTGTEADPPRVSGRGHRASIDRPPSTAERATLS